MHNPRTAHPAISRRTLSTSDLTTRVVTVVSLVVLICIFISVPAQSTPTVVKTLYFSGFINGDSVRGTGTAITDAATEHAVGRCHWPDWIYT